jgi:hypothetical protein
VVHFGQFVGEIVLFLGERSRVRSERQQCEFFSAKAAELQF